LRALTATGVLLFHHPEAGGERRSRDPSASKPNPDFFKAVMSLPCGEGLITERCSVKKK